MSDRFNDIIKNLEGKKFSLDNISKANFLPVTHSIQSDMQKTQEMLSRLQEDKMRKEIEKEMDVERRHKEILESNQNVAQAISTALAQGKTVTISIQDSNITNLQQNIESTGNVQKNYANQGIDIDELIKSLKMIFEYLPTVEEQKEANEALVELKETIDAQEQPKKGIVNYLKSLVRKVIENPIAALKGTNVLIDEGEKSIHSLQTFLQSPPV
jgi:NhaP-type Na+/H+ and K+/H+ antiporter